MTVAANIREATVTRVDAHREAANRAKDAAVDAVAKATERVTREWLGNAFLAVPVILINAFAVLGQQKWAVMHATDGDVWLAWGFAAALESVGVFLAYEAHRSLLAGDAALRLRLASYAVAGIVGALNYEVHTTGWAPTPAAIAFGTMSAISPWLWSVRSRSLHRAKLRAAGLIDGRTVRFSQARWLRFPSRTFRVWSEALWLGIVDPDKAIAHFEANPPTPKDKRAGTVGCPAVGEGPAPAGDTTPLVPEGPTYNSEPRNLEVVRPAAPARTSRKAAPGRRTALTDAELVAFVQAPERAGWGVERLADAVRGTGRSVSEARIRKARQL